jgi:DNA-binding GntR family transcriptional regulator
MAVKGHREILNGIERREAKNILEAVEKHLKVVFNGMEEE